ncbi:MAG: hypothetical protein L6R37_007426 [Teloschistes peruensis]|nr:MAG: hypothetical protein L6R37_007426 [Teloschistes peruensis]
MGRLEAATTPQTTYDPDDDADAASLNINSTLVNPFVGKTHKEMNDLIDAFMEKTKIDEIYAEHIRKGAFLAQDSEAFADIRDDGLQLRQEERAALTLEDPKKGNKWNQPWILYALVGCCSLGAAVQGWDETAVNSGTTRTVLIQMLVSEASSIQPLICAVQYLVAGMNTAVPTTVDRIHVELIINRLTDPLNRLLGRRGTIFVTCMISSLACLWQAFTNTWWHLFIARFMLGLGIGPKSATIPIYAAECTPANIRGALVMMWQMWTAFGIMLGYIAGVVFRSVLDGGSEACSSDKAQSKLRSIECVSDEATSNQFRHARD